MARHKSDWDPAEMGTGFIKGGSFVSDEGETGCHWAIYDRKAVEAEYQDDVFNAIENDPSRFARDLTGWARFYSGPGRAFGSDPCCKLYRHKILVWQRTGLDI